MVIYLGLLLPAGSCDLPLERQRATAFLCSLLVLLRMGFTEPSSRLDAGELLPRLSILTITGGLFLLHYP